MRKKTASSELIRKGEGEHSKKWIKRDSNELQKRVVGHRQTPERQDNRNP